MTVYVCPKCGYHVSVRSDRAEVAHRCPAWKSQAVTFKKVDR